jgi:hypothetical protein
MESKNFNCFDYLRGKKGGMGKVWQVRKEEAIMTDCLSEGH